MREGGERNGVCVCVCVCVCERERERDCSTTLNGRNHSIGYCTSSPNTHTDDLLSMMTQKPNMYMYLFLPIYTKSRKKLNVCRCNLRYA